VTRRGLCLKARLTTQQTVKAGRRAGISEDALMKMGGWKTLAMVSRYSIFSESDQRATDGALEAQLAREANSPVQPPFRKIRPRRRRRA
jgi:hypothetical protein